MDNLERRLQLREDIGEIGRLKARYCDACDDDHNGDTVACLFTEEGIWEYHGLPPHEGREAIAAHMFSIRAAGSIARSAHHLSNAVIDVDGDTATARWRFTMFYIDRQSGKLHHIIGRYEDRLLRHQGQWLFQKLCAKVEFRGVSEGQLD